MVESIAVDTDAGDSGFLYQGIDGIQLSGCYSCNQQHLILVIDIEIPISAKIVSREGFDLPILESIIDSTGIIYAILGICNQVMNLVTM